jgi:hypothetical protein
MKEAFHFTPTLPVGFRFPTNTDYEAFKETMLQATMLLLELSRDAVLLFNGKPSSCNGSVEPLSSTPSTTSGRTSG